jgi:hypothetical protein
MKLSLTPKIIAFENTWVTNCSDWLLHCMGVVCIYLGAVSGEILAANGNDWVLGMFCK